MMSADNEKYPARYESRLTLKDGSDVLVRPVSSSDEALLKDLFGKLSSESQYLRFLRPLRALPEDMLFRLTHIDYDRNFALAAVIPEDGRESVIAVVRYGYDPDEKVTDFAIVVRDDWQGRGLGEILLRQIFAIGREHGITRFVSVMDSTNRIIKQMLRKLDCQVTYSYKQGGTQVEVRL